jgi:transcriptional regulator with XRE-family HTH domain
MLDNDFLQLQMGGKLRRIREDRARSIADVADATRIDADLLQAYEDDSQVPAISELLKIANVLDVSIGHFFQTAIPEKRVEVVRATDRWSVRPTRDAAVSLNYRYHALSHGLTDKLMSPFLIEIPPSEEGAIGSSSHEGEEFVFVLDGLVEITVGDEVHELGPGDAMYYDSRLIHSLRSREGSKVRLLACIAQPRVPRGTGALDRTID